VFAGTDVARPPLPDADALLATLRPAIAGLQDPEDVLSAINQQLAGVLAADVPPGYLVSEGVSLQLNITTATPEIMAVLAPIAMAALAPETPASAQENMRFAADRLLGARAGITGLQATLGITEGSAERMASRLAAQAMAAQTAQAQLVSVDPYDTATRLERAQFNLEALYAVTVRMSRLSLAEYL
jgi:flagellar hook-associated protein 3 FlgL